MIVSASDAIMAGVIKFELDDTTLVALVAGVMAAGNVAYGQFIKSIPEVSDIYVDAARAIVAEAKKTPKEGNP